MFYKEKKSKIKKRAVFCQGGKALDTKRIGTFISQKRKELKLTQLQIAEKLGVSYQAVSKWENGSLPNGEMLVALARILGVTVDEILAGELNNKQKFSYSKAGVDISYTNAIKNAMKGYLNSSDDRVLNGIGAFASLYDIDFPDIKKPILVLKAEEPGSKQKLAMEYGYSESICHDMINHLVNDIVVMGATPLAVLDTIVCGKAEKDTITSFIKGISEACKENECSLVGGETSIQPQVINGGTYILTSSIAGIVSKDELIDGSKITDGDIVLAIESNGLHTNGYSLVRMLMEELPQIKLAKIEEETFIEQIMKPHTPYYPAIKELLGKGYINGMAHITGGGIKDNLSRVIPNGLTATIDLEKIAIPPIFSYIKKVGQLSDEEMLLTFNCGVGFVVVVPPEYKNKVEKCINKKYACYEIGRISKGNEAIRYLNNLNWNEDKMKIKEISHN